jgi:pyruvate,water dikinase
MLLLNIPEIESADAVKSLDRFAALIQSHAGFAKAFTEAAPTEALRLLQAAAPAEISASFKAFMHRHGHRCVRESELREKTWEENPMQLIHILQSRVRLGRPHQPVADSKKSVAEALSHLPLVKRTILKTMIPTARKAVARREISKALSIKMVDIVRKAYQVMADRLTREGLLDDPDQIYFLTQHEIGRLIETKDPVFKSKASRRRILLPETSKLFFEEICFGKPEPLDREVIVEITENQLKGTPVSQGIAEGRVRIVHNLEQADQLQEGEIMVASFTDIGWTPWFSIIAGLVTEIGSPLSHGAVVAREYGIPAVVGAKGAKQFLKNGDIIRLNGNLGIIEKI